MLPRLKDWSDVDRVELLKIMISPVFRKAVQTCLGEQAATASGKDNPNLEVSAWNQFVGFSNAFVKLEEMALPIQPAPANVAPSYGSSIEDAELGILAGAPEEIIEKLPQSTINKIREIQKRNQ